MIHLHIVELTTCVPLLAQGSCFVPRDRAIVRVRLLAGTPTALWCLLVVVAHVRSCPRRHSEDEIGWAAERAALETELQAEKRAQQDLLERLKEVKVEHGAHVRSKQAVKVRCRSQSALGNATAPPAPASRVVTRGLATRTG